MNGWIKKFADGTSELGSDELVEKKMASWSRGRLANMTGVELHHNGTLISLEGIGEFWQSDDWECLKGNSTSMLVTRRIQKKLGSCDVYLGMNGYGKYKTFKISLSKHDMEGQHIRKISDNREGQWFTVEITTATGLVIFDFKENRI